MRRFVLERRKDVSGVSGTGIVAEGVEFTDGRVSVRWLGDRPSTVDFDSLDDAVAIHGHGNLTRAVWLDPKPPRLPGTHTILYPDHSEVRCYCQIGQTHLYVEPWQVTDPAVADVEPTRHSVYCHICTGLHDPADHRNRPSAVPAHATIREDPHSHKPMWYWADEDGEHAYPTDQGETAGQGHMRGTAKTPPPRFGEPRPLQPDGVPSDQVERLAGVTPDNPPTEATPGWERCGIMADGYCAHVEHHWGTGGAVRIGKLP